MLIVISPAKSLDYDTPIGTDGHTLPEFIDEAAALIDVLVKKSPAEIGTLMQISDKLAALNVARYAEWSRKFTSENSRQAVLAFNGDVYEGLDAPSMNDAGLQYLQSHLRILSGLYGLLRPLDLLQPYRLEMGTRLANPAGKDLYAFWGSRITDRLNQELEQRQSKALINLASEEYFKSVKSKQLIAPVITPVFEDWKGGRYKIISFHAKRARGLMTRFAALKGITEPDALKDFNLEGYRFQDQESTATQWLFRRKTEE